MSRFQQLLDGRDALLALLHGDGQIAMMLAQTNVVIGLGLPNNSSGTGGIAFWFHAEGVEPADLVLADIVMRADEDTWDRALAANPASPFHHFLAMRMRCEDANIDGDEQVFAQHAHIARRLVELTRQLVNGRPEEIPEQRIDRSNITGRYVTITVQGRTVDVHVEETGDSTGGTGAPLVVLHTAGADARQAHALMSDQDLTLRHRIVAFDLPGHGWSESWEKVGERWTLTEDLYVDTILAVLGALGLDRPILLGASMAGEACLAMALRAPHRVRGVVACEASDFVAGRTTLWPSDPHVNGMIFTPEWIDGLISPEALPSRRADIRRQYSQGGLGTFPGDIDFYSGGWDARDRITSIDTKTCPVVMLTGEFDYSCTPSMSELTAAKIAGAQYWTMPGLGHFPLCENPAIFLPHLHRALELIEGTPHA